MTSKHRRMTDKIARISRDVASELLGLAGDIARGVLMVLVIALASVGAYALLVILGWARLW